MKVTAAYVVDPRTTGEYEFPYLRLTVDEEPAWFPGSDRTISTHQFIVSRFGPFWAIDSEDNRSDEELCGTFNVVLGVGSLVDRVVPVEVVWGIGPDDAASFAVGISRARRWLRKFDQDYIYTLSDLAARKGMIAWELEHNPLICMYENCGDEEVVETLRIYGVQIPACKWHIPDVRHLNRTLREQRERASQ